MRLVSDTKLKWGNNLGREHTLSLAGNLRLEDIFETDDPTTELTLHSTGIRATIVRMLLETHLPDLIGNTGVDATVPGTVQTQTSTKWKSSSRFQTSGQSRPLLASEIDMEIRVKTDRPVNAVQALSAGKIVVAEAMADQLIHSLRERYLGVTETTSEFSVSQTGDEITRYRATHRSPGADRN